MKERISSVRTCTTAALGCGSGFAFLSISRTDTPCRFNSQAVVSPTGPAPITITSAEFMFKPSKNNRF
jgi:hypothetical protein